jgi:hypothetical protein
MKKHGLPAALLLLLGLALVVVSERAGRLAAEPPQLPSTPSKPEARVAGLLNEAYDQLATVSVWMSSDQARLPRDDARLFEDAKEYYRAALQASNPRTGDLRRAETRGLAATDAARGLLFALAARAAPVVGLPSPPELPAPEFGPPPSSTSDRSRTSPQEGKEVARAPAETIRDLMQNLNERFRQLPEGKTREEGGAFLEAGRRSLEQARKALDDGRNRQALQFALAAEAWSHVPEDLSRTTGETPSGIRGNIREFPPAPTDRPRPPGE